MDKAADRARQGDLLYFESLTAAELASLITKLDEDRRSLLHAAASGGNPQLVDFLLSKGAKAVVNNADDEGWTPLQSAVSSGHATISETLISAGANVNSTNAGGRTPLHYAASKGNIDLVRLLLKHGASVNAKDSTGSTPLHRAASAGRLSTVKALVDDGRAQMEIKDATGATPLLVAVSCQQGDIAVYLTSKGADLEAESKDGETPMGSAGKLKHALLAAKEGGMDVD